MKRMIYWLTVFFISFVFGGVSWAEVDYYNARNEKISQEAYQKVIDSWQLKAKENMTQRAEATSDDGETHQKMADPVQIRKKRMEQWKAFRDES